MALEYTYEYTYTVRLADTDAAGVLYFTNLLRLCHEAYEAALAAQGCDWRHWLQQSPVLVPIAHCEADFLAPLFCGDRLQVSLTPQLLQASEFAVRYQVFSAEAGSEPGSKLCARARTRHVCIQRATRQRCALPSPLAEWVQPGPKPDQP